jgi:uncharacterized protein (UPF0212 family)
MAKINYDELKPHHWIVIIGEVEKDEGWQDPNPWMGMRRNYTPDGKPLEVLAVDLPFILVEAITGEKFAVDVRRLNVQRCSKKYVEAADRSLNMQVSETNFRVAKAKRKKIKVKKDPRDCPICGRRMRHRKIEASVVGVRCALTVGMIKVQWRNSNELSSDCTTAMGR